MLGDTVNLHSAVIPRAFVLKQMTLSESSTQLLLGYIGKIKTTKTVLFISCLVIGLGTLAGGFFYFLKFKKAKAAESTR